MGLSRQYAGSYFWGFALFAVLALAVLVMMRGMPPRWTRTWAEKGGRAQRVRTAQPVRSTEPTFLRSKKGGRARSV